MTLCPNLGLLQVNPYSNMTNKRPHQNQKKASAEQTKRKAPLKKNVVPMAKTISLTEEITSLPILEVAKIAALLLHAKTSLEDSVDQAYSLLANCAVARNGIRKGFGDEFWHDGAHGESLAHQRFWLRPRRSKFRLDSLKIAFPEIFSTPPDEPRYHVPFEEGLAKLMGKNTTISQRPEILRRFMEAARESIMGGQRCRTKEDISHYIEIFKLHGIDSHIYEDFWVHFPAWRAADIRLQKANNAKKARRGPRLPKTDGDQSLCLSVMEREAKDGIKL